MAQQTFTREEVINKLNVLLERHAPSLMDAITNEHTDFDGEELLILAEQTTKPMAQQTAVDWLENQAVSIDLRGGIRIKVPISQDIIKQAKQMEREQVKKAYNDALAAEKKVDYFTTIPSAEQYYNETYGNNQNK